MFWRDSYHAGSHAMSIRLLFVVLIVLAAPCLSVELNEKGKKFFESLMPTDAVHSGDRGDGWRVGRATFYGNEPWLWSIHEGSCGYGYIWEDEPLGWDVAALPDVHYEFAGSCGTCYEVACDEMDFKDNYGNHLDRSHVCHNPGQSVVVRITDTCPCNYLTNSYSNKRWCCGDMDHFDLSVWAFEKLAETKWGVIGLKYRPVSCDYVPPNPAPAIANPTPGEAPTKPRPYWLPKAGQSLPSDQPIENRVEPAQSPPVTVYSGDLMDSWWEKSWNSQRVYGWKGPSGGDAFCSEINSYGALAIGAKGPDFDNHVTLEMWVRTAEGVPDVKLQLAGNKGECGMVLLKDLQSSGENNGFSRYTIYLGLFDFGAHQARVTAFASEFKGCGGNTAADIKDLFIRNDQGSMQFVCIDNIQLI